MKKMFVVAAVCALTGCSFVNGAEQNKAEKPRFVTDVPYDMNNMYAEHSNAQMYSVVAARTTNKMLAKINGTEEFSLRPRLYVMQIKKTGVDHVPDGFYKSRTITKEIIKGSDVFVLVDNMEEADYYLDATVNLTTVDSLPGDILQYRLTLIDKDNKVVDSWLENIRQVQNDDRSWW